MPNNTERDVNINSRASREAASARLDRRYFTLGAEAFEEFTGALDSPPASNPMLRRLLTDKAPWDR